MPWLSMLQLQQVLPAETKSVFQKSNSKLICRITKHKVKVPGFSPSTSCFASRADVSRVTPTPHHGVTHGSNVLVDKSHSQTPTRVRSAVLENMSSARYQLYYPDALQSNARTEKQRRTYKVFQKCVM